MTDPHHLERLEYVDQNLNSWNNYFWLKNDDEKWSRIFYFEILRAPSELLLSSAKKSSKNSRFKSYDFSPLILAILGGTGMKENRWLWVF